MVLKGRENAQFKEESDVASGQQVIRSVALGLGSFRQRGGIREVLPFWAGYLFGISPWSCFETISYIFGFEKVWFIRYSTLLLVGLYSLSHHGLFFQGKQIVVAAIALFVDMPNIHNPGERKLAFYNRKRPGRVSNPIAKSDTKTKKENCITEKKALTKICL